MGSPSHGGEVVVYVKDTTSTYGDVVVYVKDINQLSLPTPFLYSVLVSVFVFIMALSTVLHSINSPDSSFFHSSLLVLPALLVFSTVYFFMKVSFSSNIIRCG